MSPKNAKVNEVGLFMMPELVWSCMRGKVRMGSAVFNVDGCLDGERPEPRAEICVE